MLNNLSISHKGAIVVLLLLLMEFSIVGALVAEFNALSHSLAAERHVLEVLDHANSYLYWTQRYSIDFCMAVFATPNSTPHKDESYNRSIPNMHRELQASEHGSYFFFVRDCTEDKRIEQLIAKQEQGVRYAIENMTVGIGTTDEAWRIQSLNKRAEAMLARTGNDLTQTSINEVLKVREQDGTKFGDTEVTGLKRDIDRNGTGFSTTDGGSSNTVGSRYSTTDDADTKSDTVDSTNCGDKATGTLATTESLSLTSMLSTDSTAMPIQCVGENSEEGLAIKISAKNLRLPSTVKEALFSRYVLLTPDLSGAGSSSGIGLALSRAVVQAHGGGLAIERSFDRDVIGLRLPATAVKHIDSLS